MKKELLPLKPFDPVYYREKLEEIRNNAGISYHHLSRIIDVAPMTLYNFMKSNRSPSWATKKAIRQFVFRYENQDKEVMNYLS